jgi:hypothetical protein
MTGGAPEHVVGFTAWSSRGTYTLTVSSTQKQAATIDAFVDDSMPTVHLSHRAPTGLSAYQLGSYAATVFYSGTRVIVGVVALIWHRRRSKKKKRKRKKKARAVREQERTGD